MARSTRPRGSARGESPRGPEACAEPPDEPEPAPTVADGERDEAAELDAVRELERGVRRRCAARTRALADVERAGAQEGFDARSVRILWGTPREVLARISNGDPLALRARVAQSLRERAVLLDGDRVHLRALARCARESPRLFGTRDVGAFLDASVRRAVDELVAEDLEAGRNRTAASGTGALAELAGPLGLDPTSARDACSLLNARPLPERRALFGLLIDNRSLDELAREAGTSASEVGRRARRALDAALRAVRLDGSASVAVPAPEVEPGVEP